MKIQEKRYHDAGLGGGHWEYRVRELSVGEETPPDAFLVPGDTEEHDWLPEHRAPVVTEEVK